MIKTHSLLLLFSATLCAGQSVLTTPNVDMQPARQNTQSSAGVSEQSPTQVPDQTGEYTTREARTLGTAANRTDEGRVPAPHFTRIVGPLTTKSEFEQYAEDATGRRLPVYGRQLFDEAPTTFAPVENVAVPADYMLGPGDQLLIRAWGKIDLDASVTVDRNGQINLPTVGTLAVAGLSYAQADAYLHSAIGAMFKDFHLNVALGRLRSIQIYVLGDARQPGAYTVSSMSTLVDALFTSGGPSATGTMRRIQLRRGGKTLSEFDLYDLIRRGDKSHDVRLLPGDILFIPSIGPQIAISGDVNQPGIYELKGESTVGAILEDAGGMTSLADAERAVLERIESHSSRTVAEFALDAEGRTHPVKDGDLLRVFPLSPKFANAITLRGSVSEPGLYAWKEGMRVSDLIPSRAFLITRDYWNKQNHLVEPGSNRPFAIRTADASGNSLTDAQANLRTDAVGNQRTDAASNPRTDAAGNPRTDAAVDRQTDIMGNPRTSQPDAASSRTVAAIGQNSAEINWEYALIERLDEHDLSTRLIPFRLASAIDNPASADNQILKPGDVVTIFSRADLELPMEKHASFVRVGGEVNAPGIYRVNPGDTLRDVVEKAGGLTPHSYLYAAVFTRVSTRKAQETQLRQSAAQMQRELTTRYSNAMPQAGQSGADQQAQFVMHQAALANITAIEATGRVVLNMKHDSAAIADIPDFPLEDGDAFYIPPRLSTVQVAGAVYNANAFRYEPEKQLIKYLNDAGGATRDADQKRIFVIRADGTVVSRQARNLHMHGGFQSLKLEPGDAVVVPEKLRVSSKMGELLQTTQFMSQLGLTAAALSIIR
ncbi:MAG: SLBB domain-containing protein [Acidobacteriaceae bacterium]|nr:SLBB domain-containing protein [Acidobacteriaceae bacterium]